MLGRAGQDAPTPLGRAGAAAFGGGRLHVRLGPPRRPRRPALGRAVAAGRPAGGGGDGQPAAGLIAHTARDIHPPAYYLLLHYWTRLAGQTEFALAFFSLAFGLLLIPLTSRLARLVANKPVAVWAALLVAFSPYHIWYSQEVRMYTLGAALGLGAAYCGLCALSHRPEVGEVVNSDYPRRHTKQHQEKFFNNFVSLRELRGSRRMQSAAGAWQCGRFLSTAICRSSNTLRSACDNNER